MSKLSVLVAESHKEIRAIVVALLSSDFEVVGAVGDGEQLVQGAMLLHPDVIVTDIGMPLMDGFSARIELRSKGIDYPFVYTTMLNLDGLANSLEPSPVGYVHKMDLFDELKLAIREVARGRSYVSKTFRDRLEDQ